MKNNSEKENSLVTYKDMAGNEVKLSIPIINRYISPGVTDKEAMMFLMLCKNRGLNPFTGQAFLIKYKNHPATMVVGKEAFMERAAKNPDYNGMKAGIIVDTGEGIVYRSGCFYIPKKETLVGGWAEAFRKSWDHPIRIEVPFDEYIGRKKSGENSPWEDMPATMIRKVAIVQALREAFPSDLSGMYDAAETGKTSMIDISKIIAEKSDLPSPTNSQDGKKTKKVLSDLLNTYDISHEWILKQLEKKGISVVSIEELDDRMAQGVINGIKKMTSEDILEAQKYRGEEIPEESESK